MIVGIGVDIVEIRRIETAMNRTSGFLEKIFTDSELKHLKSRNLRPEYIAGRFAAKEAVSKALGTGFRSFNFKDIIVENTALGKPIVTLSGNADLIAKEMGEYNLQLSISHGEDNAIAYAILEVRLNGE
ncbi:MULTISPECIES: holo-ACP synthase [unclassified Clostridium]|uniref:holo-ACP synthase n=1 Tax=unclassified Clostridium TaxID=2614128 RepID=UPI000EDC9C92|nr:MULTISPECIES: holo-ACP synthase [unclassified Clostridium]HCQ90108.1 holo-ACP synthase [Clostridium sp.]